MERKKLIWIGMTVGSFVGGYIPEILGAGSFSIWQVFTTAAGGILGIWVGYKLGN